MSPVVSDTEKCSVTLEPSTIPLSSLISPSLFYFTPRNLARAGSQTPLAAHRMCYADTANLGRRGLLLAPRRGLSLREIPHLAVARDIVNTALTNGWMRRVNAYVYRMMPAALAFLFARGRDF